LYIALLKKIKDKAWSAVLRQDESSFCFSNQTQASTFRKQWKIAVINCI